MGRKIVAEDYLLNYLTSLVRPDGYTIGLILGQSTEEEDFVFHLAKTPPPAIEDIIGNNQKYSKRNIDDDDDIDKYVKSIHSFPESWIAENAKHVTRMLPGGTHVLGIFIVSPGDVFSDNSQVQKLRSILLAIYRNLGVNEYLYGNNVHEHLVLNYNSITKKYNCKSTNINESGIFKPADWKFQKKATKWHKLETIIDMDRLFLIPVNDKKPRSLKNQLEDMLKITAELVNLALVMIDDFVISSEETLDAIAKLQKDNKDCKDGNAKDNIKPFQVGLYIPCKSDQNCSNVQMTHCNASMRLLGQIVSRTFVHQKATMKEVSTAVKQDIIRSLASRLEMHWDSLIEEENGSPEDNVTYHEPPRRVLVELPESKVTLSDYLFPGEGAQEALTSLQELLDLQVLECNIQKDLELQVDAPEFYSQNEMNVITAERLKSVVEDSGIMVYFVFFGVAFVVVIAAIVIYQLNQN